MTEAAQKEAEAMRALRDSEQAARSGTPVAQADLLEARVAARLARQEHKTAEIEDAAETVAPETEAPRQQLWGEIIAARTPEARREATARYAEYQRLVQEQKPKRAEAPAEDKK